MDRVVVRYHEVALKRGNRAAFVGQLTENIRRALAGTGVQRIRNAAGRVVILLGKGADLAEVRARLSRTFGVANFSLALRTDPEMNAMREGVLQATGGREFRTFAVRAKRADKQFPLPSPEIGRILGAAVAAKSGAEVDLEHPELTVSVEVLRDAAFVSIEKIPGPGGLPVGSSGRVLALLSGGIDSPVAAVRMMQRGCRVDFVHFHAVPLQDRAGIEKVRELADILTKYELESTLYLVPFAEVQRQIVARVDRAYRVVLYRRMMVRIAEALARREGFTALVTGESLGQVASQTLENIATIQEAVSIPVLRPLIGMDKQEISAQAQRCGTWEVSILPDQDCCQLFVPKHPITRASPEAAREQEARLDIGRLVATAVAGVEEERFFFPPLAHGCSDGAGAPRIPG